MPEDSRTPTPPSDSENATLGRYRLLGELGRGGMGIVHLAEDPTLGRRIALKVLPADRSDDGAARGRFEREARLLAGLNHPNIAILHSLEREGTRQFLTMEFVAGETLDDKIARGPLPWREAIALTHQIACALAAAHRQDVVHRDLKPKNIMLTEDQRVKVLDFGLARMVNDRGTDETRAISDTPPDETVALPVVSDAVESHSLASVAGTPGYMSPEQWLGERVEPRTDVFAFGCVLFECLTGQRLFRGKSAWERMASTLEREPDLAEISADVPAAIRSLIALCLRREPTDRPSSEEVRQRLEKEIERARVSEREDGETAVAPTPTASSTCPVPRRLDSLVGREEELAEVAEALESSPLVTLLGPGGSGKTRLALEAASRQQAREDVTVIWVDLVGTAESDLIPETIARAIGLEGRGEGSTTEAIVRWFTGARRLLVLDNCEHLIDACAEISFELLAPASESGLLATSREVLGVDGELTIEVPPLPVPAEEDAGDLERLKSSPAVELFVSRARSTSRRFALREGNAAAVGEICRRLDGIPLAIELAAARVGVLSVDQIATRLDDRFQMLTKSSRRALPRHRTLRAAIDWSHDLLDEGERGIFRRLAVFAGSFSLEAAEEVIWSDEADHLNGLDVLSQLIEKSMVRMLPDDVDGARYSLLETVREYAGEKLREAGEDEEYRRRHAEYYTGIVTGTVSRSWSSKSDDAHERVGQEIDQLRAILTRGIAGENATTAMDLAAALGSYWDLHGFWTEGQLFACGLLDREELRAATLSRTELAHFAGKFAQYLGALESARVRLQESLALARELDAPKHIAAALQSIGNVAEYEGSLDEAEACYEECRGIYESLDNRAGMAAAIGNLGVVAMDRESYDDALARFDESQEIFQELGHLRGVATCLNNSGVILKTIGDFDGAVSRVEQALELRRELDDRLGVASCLHNVSEFEHERGNTLRAHEVQSEALSLKHELGERYYLLQSVESFAEFAARNGSWERAARLLAPARYQREALGLPCPEPGRTEKENLWQEIVETITPELRAEAEEQAKSITIDVLVEFALGWERDGLV